MAINVVVVEDDDVVRESLTKIIASANDLNCIATFSNAEEFSLAFRNLKVDVVLMDIHLPGESGIETVARLKEGNPNVQFMMCTSFDDPQRTYDSLAAGATGYLLKNATPEKLKEAIRDIHNGGSPMSPEIARLVVSSFKKQPKNNELLASFSAREQEVLILLSKGFQYKEIADKLFLSVETIRTYIRDIYEKLQVHSRTDAVNKVFH
jgi:DNA-binding NarL/FixJ family response regulator